MQMERIGRSLTLFVTLPITAAGVAIIKAGKDFEKALVKTQTLVGVNEKVIASWGNQIAETAHRLGVLPVQMAEGLFAAASGFGSLAAQSPVMDVLTESTKAAALGMGELGDIARATTSIMNAFKDSNLDAKTAVSLLVVGVKEGNFEIDKLASAIGNVLGTATALGAGAGDVLAFVSAYTRLGVEPSRAVTALNTAITNLIKPTSTGKEVLEAYGLTLDEIKETVAGPDGLAGLLIRMRNSMTDQEFFSIFSQRSLRAVLALTEAGNDMQEIYAEISNNMREETDRTFSRMAEGAEVGTVAWKRFTKEAITDGEKMSAAIDEAFDAITNTLEFKFARIKSLIQTTFLGVNSAIAEPLKGIADRIIEVLENINEFARANQETVTLIIKLAIALAALGPSLIILAKVGQAIGFVTSVVGIFARAVGLAIGYVINLGVQLSVLAINIVARTVQAFTLLVLWSVRAALSFGFLIAKTVALAAVQFGATMAGWVSSLIAVAVAAGPVVIALTAIAGIALAAIGAASSLWDTLAGVGAQISESFSGHAETARGWGSNLMREFNKGILDGLIELVNILNQIGQVLAHWLSPGSPPRIAPDIDIWGEKTMQEYIDGWLKADFSVFNTIQSTIEGFLKSLYASIGDEDEDGAIPRILLGSRAAIAEAINMVRKFGGYTKEALDNIYSAIGTTTLELENYISATLDAAATTQRLADAQERVNQINEKYSRLLKPIQEQLEAIDRQRENISDNRELERLNRLIERGNLPEQVERLARLRVQEINLELQQTALEGERDAELSIAEQQLQIAQDAHDAAQLRLEFATEALGLQTRGLDLQGQMLAALDDIKDKVAKIAKGVEKIAEGELGPLDLEGIGAGGFADILGGEGSIAETVGEADKKLRELKLAAQELGETWGTVWANALAKVREWRTGIQEQLATAKTSFFDRFGPILNTLETEGKRTWENLSTAFSDFWTEIKPDLTAFGEALMALGGQEIQNAPGYIKAVSDVVNNKLIPALSSVLDIAADTVFSEDFWSTLITPPEPGEDPIQDWLDGLADLDFGFGTGEDTGFGFDAIDFDAIREQLGFSLLEGGNPVSQEVIDEWWSNLDWGFSPGGDFGIGAIDWKEADRVFAENIRDLFTVEGLEDNVFVSIGNWVTDLNTNLEEFVVGGAVGFDEWLTNITSGMGDTEVAQVGLGTGFLTLGTNTDIAREAVKLAHDKLIELKDAALETVRTKLEELRTKTEDMRLKWEDFRAKVEEVVTWVLDLASRIETELLTSLQNLYNMLFESVNPMVSELLDLFTEIYKYIKDKIEGAIDSLALVFDKLAKNLLSVLTPLREVVTLLEKAWNWLKKLPDNIFNQSDYRGSGAGPSQSGDAESAGTTDAGYAQGNAIPSGFSSAAAQQVASAVNQIPTLASTRSPRRRGSSTPTVVASPGSQVAVGNSVNLKFGAVTINNGMDMAVFEARVINAVSKSMQN